MPWFAMLFSVFLHQVIQKKIQKIFRRQSTKRACWHKGREAKEFIAWWKKDNKRYFVPCDFKRMTKMQNNFSEQEQNVIGTHFMNL